MTLRFEKQDYFSWIFNPYFSSEWKVFTLSLQETKEETLKKLFVGGLSRDTTDDQFRDYFAQFGNVTDHIVIKDGGGISK